MKGRTFASCMLLLVLLTSVLLAFTARSNKVMDNQCTEPTCTEDDTRVQAADGGLIWESVSRHLLSAVQ